MTQNFNSFSSTTFSDQEMILPTTLSFPTITEWFQFSYQKIKSSVFSMLPTLRNTKDTAVIPVTTVPPGTVRLRTTTCATDVLGVASLNA